MDDTTVSTNNTLTVRFPATSGFLRISRLNATAFASSFGFDVDALDDLRLAVDEAVTWLMTDEEAGGAVTLTMTEVGDGRGIRLEAERTGEGLTNRPVNDLAHAIFGATVESYELESVSDRRRTVVLEKLVSSAG